MAADKERFSYPMEFSNTTKQILDDAVVTPIDMIGSAATGSYITKAPTVINAGSRYANKVYPILQKGIGYVLGNGTDAIYYGGQAAEAIKDAVEK